MSTEITKAFVEQYSSNIQMLSQQKEAVWTKLQAQAKSLARNDSY